MFQSIYTYMHQYNCLHLELHLKGFDTFLAHLIHPAGTIKNSDNVKKINIAIPEPPLFISRKALHSLDHNTFTIMLLHLR